MRVPQRFRVRELLGEGGSGAVVAAFDAELGHEVALKLLRRQDHSDVVRFKREFRALCEVSHPGLVRLYELFAIDDAWAFSMEKIEGIPFDRYVRPPPGVALDVAKLQDALGQLADAVLAIHALGLVHLDLKPSNVLVEARSGRVVVLDFGLVAAAQSGKSGQILGTPAYMSPEQALGESAGQASDWFCLGVMLYEALTGARPFSGTALEQVQHRPHQVAPRPSLVGDEAEALVELCVALLRRDPRARATGADVLAVLGRGPTRATRRLLRDRVAVDLHGRRDERAALVEALEQATRGVPTVVLVSGPPGIGKTALLDDFVDRTSPSRTLTLRVRCHEREAVPQQALDGLVDAIAAALCALPQHEQEARLPADIEAVASAFPSLRRVPAVASSEAVAAPASDSGGRMRRALRAVSELVWRIAAGRVPILCFEDLEWSDHDSSLALAEVLRHLRAAAPLLLGTCRDAGDVALRSLLVDDRVAGGGEGAPPMLVRELALGPLPGSDASALALSLRPDLSPDDVAWLVAHSGGAPLVLCELARATEGERGQRPASLDDYVRARLAALGASARALLEVCVIAGRPLRLALAAEAAACHDGAAALAELRAERLVASAYREGRPQVAPANGHVRAAVTAMLSEERRRAIHIALAHALASRPEPTWAHQVEHWLAAGERSRAAALAPIAAAQAEDSAALHRAASLYELASRTAASIESSRAYALRRATCLIGAGRLAEAQADLEQLAAGVGGPARRHVQRLLLECRLRRGDVSGGMLEVRALLRAAGVWAPRSSLATVLTIAAQELWLRCRGLRVAAPPANPAPEALERIETLWTATMGLLYVSPVLSALTQGAHLRAALAHGDRQRALRALCLHLPRRAFFASVDDTQLAALAARLRVEVAAHGAPELRAQLLAGLCYSAHVRGRWRESAEHAALAERALRDHSGARWLLTAVQVHRLAASWYLGRAADIRRLMPGYLRDAEALGDVHARELFAATRGNVYWLITDEPEAARAILDEMMPTSMSTSDFLVRDYLRLQALVQIDLYQGRGDDAWARVERAWPRLRRSLISRMRQLRIESLHLRARSALASAHGRQREARLRVARHATRMLARESLPWARAVAMSLDAAIALVSSPLPRANERLGRAIDAAREVDMLLLTHTARVRQAQASGDLVEQRAAEAALLAAGVANPMAIAALLLPSPP